MPAGQLARRQQQNHCDETEESAELAARAVRAGPDLWCLVGSQQSSGARAGDAGVAVDGAFVMVAWLRATVATTDRVLASMATCRLVE
jgi:hypothetical protein